MEKSFDNILPNPSRVEKNKIKQNFLIGSHWVLNGMPRERMLSSGACCLSNAELLAVIIGSGNKEASAIELAKRLLLSFNNNLNEVARCSPLALVKKFKGIGKVKAVSILAALELGKRNLAAQQNLNKIKINSSKQAFEMLYPDMCDAQYEKCILLLLNSSGYLINKICISEGGTSFTAIDSKKIFIHALENSATQIIIAHNHPSTNVDPSLQDINLTEKLCSAAKVLDITIADHLIIGGCSYYSFADEGIIN